MATCCPTKEKKGQNSVTFLFEKKGIVKKKKVLAFGKFSLKKMTSIYMQYFIWVMNFCTMVTKKKKTSNILLHSA
jgi:hypothetical protein